MSDAGLRLRKDKCVFLAETVQYLGHQIEAQGLHPVAEKGESGAGGTYSQKYV